MRVTVRLFARLRDLAGSGELLREVPAPATVRSVWTDLVAEIPALGEYERTMSVAVNDGAVAASELGAGSEPDGVAAVASGSIG